MATLKSPATSPTTTSPPPLILTSKLPEIRPISTSPAPLIEISVAPADPNLASPLPLMPAADLTGYSIVEAADLAAAKAMTGGHPYFSEGKGNYSIEIFELLLVPF